MTGSIDAIWLPRGIPSRHIMSWRGYLPPLWSNLWSNPMDFRTDEPIKLMRDCQVVAVPAGHTLMLPQGTEVMITQSLGGSYTLLVPSYGGLFRLSNRDADAIGRETRPVEGGGTPAGQILTGEALEKEVWSTLKT